MYNNKYIPENTNRSTHLHVLSFLHLIGIWIVIFTTQMYEFTCKTTFYTLMARRFSLISISGLKVVGEVKKVGKSRNFQPKVGKSRNFSAFKVGKSRNFISVFIIVLSNMLVSFVVFDANHLFF